MIKYLFICVWTFSFFVSVRAAEERFFLSANRSPEILRTQLVQNRAWIPYPEYKDRQAWADFLKGNKVGLIKSGEKNLEYDWQIVKASAYLEYERSGNRNIMQTPDSRNISALSQLMSAELAEGKGRFIDAIIDGVFFQCERTSWVLSAHLPVQPSKRSLPEYEQEVIDLASAEIGSLLSWAYYFFHEEFDRVNPEVSKRLKYEIKKKVIEPYRTSHYWWMGLDGSGRTMNNWNPWCNFNVLQCLLLMEDDPEALSRDVYKTMLSVDQFINYISGDGACEEGPSYWGHAAGKLYDYLQVLHWATDGKISLFDNPMIVNMGEYICHSYVGNKWVVNFADASARFSSDPGLIFRYGKAIRSESMMRLASLLVEEGFSALPSGRDYFRVLESLACFEELKNTPAEHTNRAATIYPETQFYYFSNPSGFFLAAKGGFNAESHNHNDVGTFSLYYKGMPVLIDAGVGTYTRQTFGKERYSIWTMRSTHHNLPLINGVEQKFGREYRSRNVKVDARKQTLSLDIAGAYPEEAAVDTWVRGYKLQKNNLLIEDRFRLKSLKEANEVRFLVWGDIDTGQPGKVVLKIEDQAFELKYDRKQFTVDIETVELPDTRLSKVWGEQIYLLKLVAVQKQLQADYRFEVRVLP